MQNREKHWSIIAMPLSFGEEQAAASQKQVWTVVVYEKVVVASLKPSERH